VLLDGLSVEGIGDRPSEAHGSSDGSPADVGVSAEGREFPVLLFPSADGGLAVESGSSVGLFGDSSPCRLERRGTTIDHGSATSAHGTSTSGREGACSVPIELSAARTAVSPDPSAGVLSVAMSGLVALALGALALRKRSS
jgi:hypothetical protein